MRVPPPHGTDPAGSGAAVVPDDQLCRRWRTMTVTIIGGLEIPRSHSELASISASRAAD
jgi:hypothetical protein